ncbi:MAG: hypothetical protein R3F31_20775 [Verrucomicrobiales bacterium]
MADPKWHDYNNHAEYIRVGREVAEAHLPQLLHLAGLEGKISASQEAMEKGECCEPVHPKITTTLGPLGGTGMPRPSDHPAEAFPHQAGRPVLQILRTALPPRRGGSGLHPSLGRSGADPFSSKSDLLSIPGTAAKTRDFVLIPEEAVLRRRASTLLSVATREWPGPSGGCASNTGQF